jgi:hypothetical protein
MTHSIRPAIPRSPLHLASSFAMRVAYIAVATSALALGSRPAKALITIDPILTLNGDQQQGSSGGPWTFGFSFTTSSVQTFNALGVADTDSIGLSQLHDIGLYDTSGSLLASVLGVTGTADAVQDGFVWAAINPITLNPGTYIVGASGQWDVDRYAYSGTFSVDAGYTFNIGKFSQSLSLAFPSQDIGVNFFGANISSTVTPPVPAPLPVVGAAAAFGYSRKLRKRLKISKTPEVMSAID